MPGPRTKITFQDLDPSLSNTLTLALSGGTPKLSSLSYPGNDTAADPAGGQTITINGANFVSGCVVWLANVAVGVVSFVNANTVTFVSPAKAVGTYSLYLINPDGSFVQALPGIEYSSMPVWSTSSGSLGSFTMRTSVNVSVAATGDVPITYSLAAGNSLPSGLTLNSNGSITGTAQDVNDATTYTFSVLATDTQNQDTVRQFSITITLPAISFDVTPVGGSTSTWNLESAPLELSSSANTYTLVPLRTFSANVYMWGGGGASHGGTGGVGGYSFGTVNFVIGQQYTVYVGKTGTSASGVSRQGSGGGGGSALVQGANATIFLVAGGGGAAGGPFVGGQGGSRAGGPGGGSSGVNAGTGSYGVNSSGGKGGTQSAAGDGGTFSGKASGSAGVGRVGGLGAGSDPGTYPGGFGFGNGGNGGYNPADCGGGGGGGGWYGGGGGASDSSSMGGGGGSGYFNPSSTTNGSTQAAALESSVPPNSSHAYRGSAGNPSTSGKVVIMLG